MKCEKCGKENPESAKYCIACGEKILRETVENVEKSNSENVLKGKNRYKKWIIVGIIVVAVYMIFIKKDKYIEAVKEGYMVGYENVEIGDAFDKFFINEKWDSYKLKNGKHVVEFSGTRSENKEIKAIIKFVVDADAEEFEISNVWINGEKQDSFTSLIVVQCILEEVEKEN